LATDSLLISHVESSYWNISVLVYFSVSMCNNYRHLHACFPNIKQHFQIPRKYRVVGNARHQSFGLLKETKSTFQSTFEIIFILFAIQHAFQYIHSLQKNFLNNLMFVLNFSKTKSVTTKHGENNLTNPAKVTSRYDGIQN